MRHNLVTSASPTKAAQAITVHTLRAQRALRTLCTITLCILVFALAAPRVYAGTTITAPTVSGGEYVNGVLFSANVTANIARVELSASGFIFGNLNAANNWALRYSFTNLGARDITLKTFDTAGMLSSNQMISINVVDLLEQSPKPNTTYANGAPATFAASAVIKQVILKAETFEIGRTSIRDGAGQFVISPAIMGTIGARTLNAEGYNANGTKIITRVIPVTVSNISIVSPNGGAMFASGATFSAQVQAVSTTAKVDYFADNILIGSATDSSTLFKRDISLVNGGNRVIKAANYNAFNVKLGEASVTIIVSPPVCVAPQVLENGVCVTPSTQTCQFGPWISYNGVVLRRHSNGAYIYKTSNKQVDADGAANAYHPADVGKTCSTTSGLLGLDCPANAGYPNTSFWPDILAVDPNNTSKPYVQTTGTYAGFFVSMTSLVDPAKATTDPTRYVSSTSFPYIVFPGNFFALSGTGRRGDLGYAINLDNNKKSHFVVAETGPATANLGEMSIALAIAMGGISPSPINGSGTPAGTIMYVSFPSSTTTYPWPMTNVQMNVNVQSLLAGVGGEAGILACKNTF